MKGNNGEGQVSEVPWRERVRAMAWIGIYTCGAVGLAIVVSMRPPFISGRRDYSQVASFSGSERVGGMPGAGLIVGRDGGIYGVAEGAGFCLGTLFRVNAAGAGIRVVHQFGLEPTEGIDPWCTLAIGTGGVLFGTTGLGPRRAQGGTIFKMNPDGSGYRVIHVFSPSRGDGEFPRGPLVISLRGQSSGRPLAEGDSGMGRFSASKKMAVGMPCCTNLKTQKLMGDNPAGA